MADFWDRSYRYETNKIFYLIAFLFGVIGSDKDFTIFPTYNDDWASAANSCLLSLSRTIITITMATIVRMFLPFGKNKVNIYQVGVLFSIDAICMYSAYKVPSNRLQVTCWAVWTESVCLVFLMGLAMVSAGTFLLVSRITGKEVDDLSTVMQGEDTNIRRTRSGFVFGQYRLNPEDQARPKSQRRGRNQSPRRTSSSSGSKSSLRGNRKQSKEEHKFVCISPRIRSPAMNRVLRR